MNLVSGHNLTPTKSSNKPMKLPGEYTNGELKERAQSLVAGAKKFFESLLLRVRDSESMNRMR